MDKPIDEDKLLRSCIDRDLSAWDAFTRMYSPLIVSSIRLRLHKYALEAAADEICDIRQEVLSMLWEGQKLREIRNPASLKYWLSIVSGNAAMNFMQKRRRLTRLMPISLSDMDEDTLSGILEMAPNNTQRGHYGFALSDRLSGALETLSVRERLALKLSVLHGKRYEEIALMMSIPPATVSSHIRRAKEKLRKRLAGNGLP